MTTEPTATCTDIYGWQHECGTITDACMPDGTTLYGVQDCTFHDLPTFDEWCVTVGVGHPLCPSTFQPSELPATGGGTLLVVAPSLILLGVVALFAAKTRKCPRPTLPSSGVGTGATRG